MKTFETRYNLDKNYDSQKGFLLVLSVDRDFKGKLKMFLLKKVQ